MAQISTQRTTELSSPTVENVRLISNEMTMIEQLKGFCKPSYQLRRIKNKGAILILIWSYLAMNVFIYLYSYAKHGGKLRLLVLGVSLPFAGWLADVRIGRYKVVCCSMWIMWLASISTTAFSLLMQAVEGSVISKVGYYVNSVLMMIMTVGFGGYQANVIQLAIDQLHDSSTAEIKSFITWYAWAAIGGGMLEHLAIPCIASSEENSNIFRLAIICICLSIALILNSFCSHWLVKEPIGQNPFKLVYKVIKYAIKTKRPRCRSAFTYCEDNFPSRIDFGKCKYGGPFTTEQVEDVKTFLQLLPVLLVGCTFGGEIVADNGIQWYQLRLLLTFPIDHFMLQDCYSEVYFTQAFYYSAVILIPLYEFALYPALYKCHLPLKLHWKFVMGVILQMAKLISLMLIQVAARYNYYIQQHVNSELNETHHVGCMFYESRGALSLSLSYKWTAIPQFLHSISMALIFISGLEFLCAQVPYSMKGLIFGTTYGFGAISTAIALLFSILFREKLFNWSTGVISCGFWYFFQVLVVIIVISIFASIILKWYKYRKREDVLPNEQIFAEQYYTREN